MIKLRTLLNEINGEGPKAIFMAGPAGAGKSFILEQLNIEGFKTINVDDDFEELLKQEFGDDIISVKCLLSSYLKQLNLWVLLEKLLKKRK
jgi:predicted AAA+ superfamily ATPase